MIYAINGYTSATTNEPLAGRNPFVALQQKGCRLGERGRKRRRDCLPRRALPYSFVEKPEVALSLVLLGFAQLFNYNIFSALHLHKLRNSINFSMLCVELSTTNWNLLNSFVIFCFFQYKLVHYKHEY